GWQITCARARPSQWMGSLLTSKRVGNGRKRSSRGACVCAQSWILSAGSGPTDRHCQEHPFTSTCLHLLAVLVLRILAPCVRRWPSAEPTGIGCPAWTILHGH